MRPAVEPGDWLLVDPTATTWPRRGSIVVIREPETDTLAIKRVAARPDDVVRDVEVTNPNTGEDIVVTIRLGTDEAWLTGDNAEHSVDSRRYGPVSLDRLVARAWFRYWPWRRVGRMRKAA
jgi:type IV secretory pathway protease TraF